MCTDHNLDFLKANSHPRTQELLETLMEYGYVSTITKPTRVTHSSATLIDVLLNKELSIDYTSWLLLEDISDHFPCLISIKNFVPDRKAIGHILKRKMDKNAINLIKNDIAEIDWCRTLCNLMCDESFNEFHDILMKVMDIHAPECCVRKKHKKSVQPWVNKGIKRCLQKQRQLYSQWLAERSNTVLQDKYRSYKSCLQKLLRNVKKNWYSQLCLKHMTNSKKLWGIINSIIKQTPHKTNIIDCLHVNNVKNYDAKEIVNELGKHFSNVGKLFAGRTKKSNQPISFYNAKITNCDKTMFLTPTTEHEISN